jgi:hypothetical protein
MSIGFAAVLKGSALQKAVTTEPSEKAFVVTHLPELHQHLWLHQPLTMCHQPLGKSAQSVAVAASMTLSLVQFVVDHKHESDSIKT